MPKVQWERFQDFNDHESSGSEEDVFFYPEHVRELQELPRKDQSIKSDRMFSPFDVNWSAILQMW